jgi:hypothetical protein
VQDQPANVGEIRYWVRDTVALGLVSSDASFPSVDPIALAKLVNTLLPSGLSVQPPQPIVVIGQTAIAFAQLSGPAGNECVPRAVAFINYRIALVHGTLPLTDQPTVTLMSASPDFYIIEQTMDHIGGSPGGPPSWTATGSGPTANPPIDQGKGTVYVLDTADPLGPDSAGIPQHGDGTGNALSAQPATALKPLCGNDPGCLSELRQLGAGGTVDELDVPLPDEGIIGPYGPSMSIREHGLFDAAIVHHLAGKATVHLIRVLNDYGVGDLQSLAKGLALVRQDPATPSSVVVNMSLDLVPPLPCLADVMQHFENYESGLEVSKCGESVRPDSSLAPITDTLGRSIADLRSAGYVLVAAAGNDSNSASGVRYYQDLPAAYCGVVAVAGATTPMGSNWVFSGAAVNSLDPKSNRSDGQCQSLPAVAGVAPPSPVAGDAAVALGDNICSLYLQSFPASGTSAANPIGFAQWSGTSFATAYITGNLATSAIQLAAATGKLDESQPCTP